MTPKLGCLVDRSVATKLINSSRPWRPTSISTQDADWKPTTDPTLPADMILSGLQGASDCVAWAVCNVMEYLLFKRYHVHVRLSRLAAYWMARDVRGLTPYDIGCYPFDMVDVASFFGIPLEKYWPYDPSKVMTRPNEEAFTTLERVYITQPQTLYPLDQILKPIHERTPVCSRIAIFRNFYVNGPDKNGMMPMWTDGEQLIGYHYVACIGSDRAKDAVEAQNSWGGDWGKRGRFFIPRAFYENDGVSGDDYCFQDVRASFLGP